LSVCPICDTEGMNQIWQHGENEFVSICESCDTMSMMTGKMVLPVVSLEGLFEDFVMTGMHLMFGVVAWVRSAAISLWNQLTSHKPSIKL
jgi:hypothetical protein